MPSKYHFKIKDNSHPAIKNARIWWNTEEPNKEEILYNTSIEFNQPFVVNLHTDENAVWKYTVYENGSPKLMTAPTPTIIHVSKIEITNYSDNAKGNEHSMFIVNVYHDGGTGSADLYHGGSGSVAFVAQVETLLDLPLTFSEWDMQDDGQANLELNQQGVFNSETLTKYPA